MRLEPELWDALREICARERRDLDCLVREIEAAGHAGGRTSAVRVFVVQYFRAAASEKGHRAACHGQLSDVLWEFVTQSTRRGAKVSTHKMHGIDIEDAQR